ncbi:hypothetical protein FQZ97_1056620 [compost metagenome]
MAWLDPHRPRFSFFCFCHGRSPAFFVGSRWRVKPGAAAEDPGAVAPAGGIGYFPEFFLPHSVRACTGPDAAIVPPDDHGLCGLPAIGQF